MAQIKDLELIQNVDLLFNTDIVIYGIGNYGKSALDMLEMAGASVFGICDSDVSKWGTEIGDRAFKIMSPMELSELTKERKVTVIITINSPQCVKEVLKMLDYCGLKDLVCYTYFALKYVLLSVRQNLKLSDIDKEVSDYLDALLLKCQKIDLFQLKRFHAISNVISNGAILIYQPSKVGSSSVFKSIIKSGRNAEHIHFINEEWLSNWNGEGGAPTTEETQQGIELLQKLRTIKVITLVREPIGRDISQFFQRFDNNTVIKRKYNEPGLLKGIVSQIDDYSRIGQYGYQFEWFNREIKDVLGVDIYEHDFDKENGYQIIREKNMELLIIKMEKMDQCEEIIGKFVNIDNFKLEKNNIGSNKLYHFAYEEVKKQIYIPEEIVNRYYKNNKAMDHFYTEKEKDDFLKIWRK